MCIYWYRYYTVQYTHIQYLYNKCWNPEQLALSIDYGPKSIN